MEMQTVYSSDGCKVIATHRPSGEASWTASAGSGEAAAKAAEIINRGMRLNEDRHYTAAARMYARLDSIDGYEEFEDWRPLNPEAMDVCAACGQTVLTTPDDPRQALLCDVCLASLERRREVRRANAALNQGGLF